MPTPPKTVVISKKELGQRLRALRSQQSITQVELARLLGMTQSNISAMERGDRGITIHQVVKLARALRVSTDEILLGDKSTDRTNGLVDRRFLRRLRKIERLSTRDKQVLLRSLDAFLKGAGV